MIKNFYIDPEINGLFPTSGNIIDTIEKIAIQWNLTISIRHQGHGRINGSNILQIGGAQSNSDFIIAIDYIWEEDNSGILFSTKTNSEMHGCTDTSYELSDSEFDRFEVTLLQNVDLSWRLSVKVNEEPFCGFTMSISNEYTNPDMTTVYASHPSKPAADVEILNYEFLNIGMTNTLCEIVVAVLTTVVTL